MREMLEQLREYLDEFIINYNEASFELYSCKSYIDNYNDISEEISERTSQILSISSMLSLLEKENALKQSDITEITKIPGTVYNKIKNESGSLSVISKDHLCTLAICFMLSEEDSLRFLKAGNAFLKPHESPYDAAFLFFVTKWHYDTDRSLNVQAFEECKKYAYEYVLDKRGIVE